MPSTRPTSSPHSTSSNPISSETTAIAPAALRTLSYDATATVSTVTSSTASGRVSPMSGQQQQQQATIVRNGGGSGNTGSNNSNNTRERRRVEEEQEEEEREPKKLSLFKKLGSIELENKASVARDHLALERTFLAWLRTSLAFASIGIAITQLFRLSSGSSANTSPGSNASTLHALGKPLGATFLAIAILVLIVGINRYYESQAWLLRGKFPASRGSILLLTVVAAALIITSLVIILVVGPGFSEK